MKAASLLDAFCVLVTLIICSVNGELSLKYYETLHPDNLRHHITKRDASEKPHTRRLVFDSLGRHFNLLLRQKSGILSSGFKIVAVDGKNNEKQVQLDDLQLYQGYVVGEEDSSNVQASWESGDTLLATIHTKQDVYVIEPSWRHLPASDNHTMIVYKKSDIKMDDDLGESFCGYIDMRDKLEKHKGGYEDSNEDYYEVKHEQSKYKEHRQKRQTAARSTSYKPTKNTCQLMLVADYRFFKNMGQSSLSKTSSYLISLMDRVDNIYRKTDFGQGYTDMGFEINEMRIHEEPTAVTGTEEHYNMEKASWDTKPLLEVFSRDQKWSKFCLAHLFTHQAFKGGVLGLAYIGSPRTYSVGGVCSPVYHKGGYRLYLNTGWSSSLNRYNRRLLTQEADLVTTHELGHNWGSEHDPDTDECSPSSFKGGKYIMYTYSVSGYDPNNKIFSACSVRSIGAVLRGKSNKCFQERRLAYCGNNLVEPPAEECDVGPEGQKDADLCCDKDCKLRPKMKCSEKNHVCCTPTCQYAAKDVQCHENEQSSEGSCEDPAFCDGGNATCPKPPPKLDGEACLERGKCKNGVCQPFCETLGKLSCVCDDVVNSCHWCCKVDGNSSCLPEQPKTPLPDGMPCLQGYCYQGVCKKQIQDMVQRFWSIIENISPDELGEFMKANLVGCVIILSLLIWIPVSCCISWKDRKDKQKEEEEIKWLSADNTKLVRPEDRFRIRTSLKTYSSRGGRPTGVILAQEPARSIRI